MGGDVVSGAVYVPSVPSDVGAEAALGNPASDGQVPELRLSLGGAHGCRENDGSRYGEHTMRLTIAHITLIAGGIAPGLLIGGAL